MIRRPPRSTRTDTRFPYTTLFRSDSFGHLLNQLGVSTMIEGSRPEDFGRVTTLRAGKITSTVAPYDIVRKMRASILVLGPLLARARSEEHTSELQSLMRTSYAVFCLKKKKSTKQQKDHQNNT